jgi:hypothetical protein
MLAKIPMGRFGLVEKSRNRGVGVHELLFRPARCSICPAAARYY